MTPLITAVYWNRIFTRDQGGFAKGTSDYGQGQDPDVRCRPEPATRKSTTGRRCFHNQPLRSKTGQYPTGGTGPFCPKRDQPRE